jgi:hypothetical protein
MPGGVDLTKTRDYLMKRLGQGKRTGAPAIKKPPENTRLLRVL